MLFVCSRKKNNDKKVKIFFEKILPTYLSYFLEQVTPSAVARRIFTLLISISNKYVRNK